jgi:tetraacyldisaccharide 4'-kinase
MSTQRWWLAPLSPIYGAVVSAKRRMYALGWLKQRRLESPVISVGSVSAGGAGKTPVVAMLARILRQRGYAVDILTRGYGRSSRAVERVESFHDPEQHGDEAVMLAQKTRVPVFAAAERYLAGQRAEQEHTSNRMRVHLLDDGYQHLRLARSVDIVLLTLEDLEDHLLPGGNLREPVAAVAQAHVVVVREEEREALNPALQELRASGHGFLVWETRRRLNLDEGMPLPTLPLAFCGIARPENFRRMLMDSRYEPLETVEFPDHHPYRERDIDCVLERARSRGANGLVTTEKDAVKLNAALRERLEQVGPLIVARLTVELVDEREAMAQLVNLVGELDRRKTPEGGRRA